MRPAGARFGFQRPYFTSSLQQRVWVAAAMLRPLWLQSSGSLALRCASRLALWHWELWAPQQPQEGQPQTTSNQTDFLLLPNGDADVRHRPQCVNSQPKWLNGTAFLHQSHSRPSISPRWAINKGGGFYIKSLMVGNSVTCPGSAVIDRHCGFLKLQQFQTIKKKKYHSLYGVRSPENTDLALASRTPPVEAQNPDQALEPIKKQHICSLSKVFNTSIFHQNLDFPAFMAKTGHVWQKWVVWSGSMSSCSGGDQGFCIS